MCIVAAATVVGGSTVSTPSAPIPRRRSRGRQARSESIRGPSTTMKSFPSPWYFTKKSGTRRIICAAPLAHEPRARAAARLPARLLLAGGGSAPAWRSRWRTAGSPRWASPSPAPRSCACRDRRSSPASSPPTATRSSGRSAAHERRAADREDFWSWRAAMYEAANQRLGPDDLEAVARMAFHGLARAPGVTAVGGFTTSTAMRPAGRTPSPRSSRSASCGPPATWGCASCSCAPPTPAPDTTCRPIRSSAASSTLPGCVPRRPRRARRRARRRPARDPGQRHPQHVRACPEPWLAALAAEARQKCRCVRRRATGGGRGLPRRARRHPGGAPRAGGRAPFGRDARPRDSPRR